MPKYWVGEIPETCQVTGQKLDGVMYDAKIPGGGWANISHDAFKRFGCTLGVGHGQKYERQEDGRWLCTAGGATSAKAAITLSDDDRRQIADEAASRKGR